LVTSSNSSAQQSATVIALPLGALDDSKLTEALAARHAGAAAALWDRFEPLVRGLLTPMLGHAADVDDAVQVVFLTVFRRAREIREPSRLRSFVVGVAIRVARTELRRRRVRGWLRLTDEGEVPEIEARAADNEARAAVKRLYAVMDRLKPETRIVFSLRFIEGYELTDVADACGISLSTAKRRVAHASTRVTAMARHEPELARYLEDGR
jgi:RNA polymerase sigma-70 factor (ECF subfamily)